MDEKQALTEEMIEQFWQTWALEGPPDNKKRRQRIYKVLPAEARCRFCHAPFDGVGGALVKNVFRVYPSRYNNHYCNVCDEFAKTYQGGAEVPMTMLFADIRGSTTLAEKIGPKEFSTLINRFYVTSTHTLSHAGAMIEKLAGDGVTALFVPGIAGEHYQKQAVETALALLREFGHGGGDEPWVPVGIGIHSGTAFIGSVGNPEGLMEVAALGDVPNTAARLSSLAAAGEVLVSEATMQQAGLSVEGLEQRHLTLQGRDEAINAAVLQP